MDPIGTGSARIRRLGPSLSLLAAGVSVIGLLVVLIAAVETVQHPPSLRVWIVMALIVAVRPVVVALPKPLPAIAASPWIAVALAVAFGPGPATLALAFAELHAGVLRRARLSFEDCFDVVEPPIALWIASHVYAVAAAADALWQLSAGEALRVVPPLLMAVSYFGLHSTLTAAVRSFRHGRSLLTTWREDAVGNVLSSYIMFWLAIAAGDLGMRTVLVVTTVSAPLVALGYLGSRYFVRFKAETERHTQELQRLYQGAIEALAVAVDAKDQVTHGHIRRVQRHTLALASALGVRDPIELKAMEAASLLHDVGKLAVPDYVLNKPGSLTRAELKKMQLHAAKGALILEAIDFPFPVVPIVRSHHEQWNGRGYPQGLAGEQIPLGARILAVVDCFDALTSDRPYRRRLTDQAATDILIERKGIFYDAKVVDAFIELIPELRLEDVQIEASHPAGAIEEALNDPAPEKIDGTRALKVDLITPDEIGKLLRVRVAALVPHGEFCLFVPDGSGNQLWPIHASAALRPFVMSAQVHAGEGLAGWVFVNRHTIINSAPDLDFEEASQELGLKRCVSTPVFAFGTMAGVLSVYTRKAAGFTETEVRIVGAIAQELGLEFSRHDRTLTYEMTPLDAAEQRSA